MYCLPIRELPTLYAPNPTNQRRKPKHERKSHKKKISKCFEILSPSPSLHLHLTHAPIRSPSIPIPTPLAPLVAPNIRPRRRRQRAGFPPDITKPALGKRIREAAVGKGVSGIVVVRERRENVIVGAVVGADVVVDVRGEREGERRVRRRRARGEGAGAVEVRVDEGVSGGGGGEGRGEGVEGLRGHVEVCGGGGGEVGGRRQVDEGRGGERGGAVVRVLLGGGGLGWRRGGYDSVVVAIADVEEHGVVREGIRNGRTDGRTSREPSTSRSSSRRSTALPHTLVVLDMHTRRLAPQRAVRPDNLIEAARAIRPAPAVPAIRPLGLLAPNAHQLIQVDGDALLAGAADELVALAADALLAGVEGVFGLAGAAVRRVEVVAERVQCEGDFTPGLVDPFADLRGFVDGDSGGYED
jgi:hypothetical protein